MGRNWNQDDLSKLAARGMRVNIPPTAKNRIIIPKSDCAQVQWMHWNLQYFCNEEALTLEKEYTFSQKRKFRFDFALPAIKVGVEYDGIYSDKSRHTTHSGFTEDANKMNLAATEGWRVLKYTSETYTNVLSDLRNILSELKPQ